MKSLYIKLLSLTSTYSIGNLTQNVLSVLLLPLYTSYLSLADFGILALMDLTIFLINRPVVTPFLSAFVRFYYKPEYESKNGLFLFNLFFVLLIKTILLGGLYWLFTGFLSGLLFADSQAYLPVVRAYMLILLLQPLGMFLLQLIMTREMARYYVFVSLSKVFLVTGATVYFLTSWQLGLFSVVYATVLGLAFEILMALPILWRYSTFKLSPKIVYEPLRYGYPLLISGYSNILMESGDRYLLNILTSVSSVGLYSFGYRIARVVNLLLITPLKQTVAPIIFQKEKDPQEQKQLITGLTTYFYWFGVFMTLGLSLVAREAIILLASQPDFWSAWTLVPVIAFSYVQFGLGSFFGWGIVLRNKSQYLSGLVLIGALVNIGLNLIFIPYWGVLGAAFATLISYGMVNGLYAYYSAKFYELYFEWGRLGYITLVGSGLYIGAILVANVDFFLLSLALKMLFLLSYPLFFLLPGFLSATEKLFLNGLWRKGLNFYSKRKELPVQ